MEYLYISDNEINKGNWRMVLCGLILNGNRSSSPPTLWTTSFSDTERTVECSIWALLRNSAFI
jgi:hypothetical protein